MTAYTNEFDIKKTAAQFCYLGAYKQSTPSGSGHINDTYAITTEAGNQRKRYILQRINHHVFKDPERLILNIARVTKHIRRKLEENGVEDAERRVLTLVPTVDGKDFFLDEEGCYWRSFVMIEGASTHDRPQSSKQVYEAARAFGRFQAYLTDLSSTAIEETIPDFHNTRKRFDTFISVLERDPFNRAQYARNEIKFICSYEGIIDRLLDLNSSEDIPTRIIHNDTKLNNVMIDDITGEGICVIDLDTVMPGLSLYDYGDCIRSGAGTSEEDERDLSKAGINLELFEAITTGYLSTAGQLLSATEMELMPHAAKLITLETGIRFLTDHLEGDIYFKTHRENHNLDRCRVQLERVKAMTELTNEIDRIAYRARSTVSLREP